MFVPDICEVKEGSTTRPNLLTEADLVGLMDKNGIGMSLLSTSYSLSTSVGATAQADPGSSKLKWTGTDATIAEHISKIIERGYVHERQEARTKYLVPSPLGAGLVQGYNEIGFDRSLTKPHLRAEVSI